MLDLRYISVAECLSSTTFTQCARKLSSSVKKNAKWATSPFKVIKGH